MGKFFEVTVEEVLGRTKTGREKKQKQPYLVDAQSPTEAEAKVISHYVKAQVMLDYRVVGAKESRIVEVVQ